MNMKAYFLGKLKTMTFSFSLESAVLGPSEVSMTQFLREKKKTLKKKKKKNVAGVAHRISYIFVCDVIYVYCLLHPEEAVMAKH